MRHLIAAVAAVLLLAFAASAQYYVEADLNGVVGDPQPDYVVTTMGQTVPVDIWLMGPPNSFGCFFGATLCESAQRLVYLNAQPHLPPGWWLDVEGPDSSGCLSVGGQDLYFCDVALAFPCRVATVSYEASVDQTIAEIALGPGSGVLTQSFSTEYFDNDGEILARIQIGDVTATEETSWGSIKTLFR